MHKEPIHLLFNLYWLWILGGAFERTFGPVRCLLFILVSAFVSSGLQEFAGSGIGLSGVGYALFGFGWAGRRRFPEFARFVNDGTVRLFVLWGLLCVALTYMRIWQIGNVAHLSGALFGAALAGLIVVPEYKAVLSAALVLMMSGSVGVLFWNPRSGIWLANQAEKAQAHGEISKAADLYRRALSTGDINPAWAWESLAIMYGEHGMPEYREAFDQLKQVDPSAANELAAGYGDPDANDSSKPEGVK